VVSKPPDPAVADDIRAFAQSLGTPVEFALIGPGQPDLTAAAEQVLRAIGADVPEWPQYTGDQPKPRSGALRGLFAGGTLCDEAMIIAGERLGQVSSNIALRPEWRIDPNAASTGHVMIDFGDDELTAGRPHPMIDQSLRLARLEREAADPTAAVILLDVVLGHGAHADPASELAPAIAAVHEAGDVAVVVSIIGAKADPQDVSAQAAALRTAGAHVFTSNAQAARFACDLIVSDS
jgi:FdrA protein